MQFEVNEIKSDNLPKSSSAPKIDKPANNESGVVKLPDLPEDAPVNDEIPDLSNERVRDSDKFELPDLPDNDELFAEENKCAPKKCGMFGSIAPRNSKLPPQPQANAKPKSNTARYALFGLMGLAVISKLF